MLFNSLSYLIFLPVIVTLYYITPWRFRWVLLFTGSCYFYMYFIPKYIFILFLLILIDYVAAILIARQEGQKRKLVLFLSLAANICLLCFFKYIYFIDGIVQDMLSLVNVDFKHRMPEIILPIGLSFHTFQSMAYTIEVYKRRQTPEKHLGVFAVYVLFFPQMVAGPIERFATLGNQLKQHHVFKWANIRNGLQLILFGLFIKMSVADNLAPMVNEAYLLAGSLQQSHAIVASLFFSFQIYADFFGYSTIALGSALLMGINLINNFKAPYLSKTISEFWGRWHISLSTWFRDYLYISLGGNKVSALRWAVNILVVFAVSGLWHGANWTFVAWGLIHACMYLLERLFKRNALKESSPLLSGAHMLIIFSVVTMAWVFFRSASFDEAARMMKNILLPVVDGKKLNIPYVSVLLLAFFIAMDIVLKGIRFDKWISQQQPLIRWSLYFVLLFCIMVFASGEEQPFIYFQF